MIVRTGDLGELTFSQVWPIFLEEKKQEVGPRTYQSYIHFYRALGPFFGDLRLKEIHIGNIVAYRATRVTAGPGLINHEINAVSQLLNKSGLWADIAKFYKPLRVPQTGPGQALLEEEALCLLEVASRKKQWQIAYLGSMVSANTACGPGEIRNLRLKDVNFDEGVLNIVEGAKNRYRLRTIPLNTDALWAVRKLAEIALEKGSHAPEHYLIPGRPGKLAAADKGPGWKNKPHHDPTRPTGSWKKAWYSLRREAGKKYPKLAYVRMYDLRHHALTTLLEDPTISEQTIKDIAGHVSKKILERYSHIRIARKRAALEALEGLRKRPLTMLRLVEPKRLIH